MYDCMCLHVVHYRGKQAQQGRQASSLAESSRIHVFLDVPCFLLLWIFMDVRVVVGFAYI